MTSILPWSFLLGCGPDGSDPDVDITDTTRPTQVAPSVVLLTPAERLNRISMALRGIRPSYDDLVAVEVDPSILESLVDGYLDDREFGDTMRDLHADTLMWSRWLGYDYQSDPALGYNDRKIVDGPYSLVRGTAYSITVADPDNSQNMPLKVLWVIDGARSRSSTGTMFVSSIIVRSQSAVTNLSRHYRIRALVQTAIGLIDERPYACSLQQTFPSGQIAPHFQLSCIRRIAQAVATKQFPELSISVVMHLC